MYFLHIKAVINLFNTFASVIDIKFAAVIDIKFAAATAFAFAAAIAFACEGRRSESLAFQPAAPCPHC